MVDQTRPQFGPIQIGIIILTLATAIIHITLLFPNTLFILNGLGYIALLAALYLPIPQLAGNRNLVRWALLAFAAVTIIAWIAIGARGPLAYATKAIEVVLIVLLYMDSQQS